ncbi:hypothetical protein FNV43_RR21153 [Rhamnella rubrinervis]|uniref:Uncharacterized protein n=1 Tax=Rhamnella rubrinervis TaxID=2594499 RepID=A0A8K0E167_9ROSA|nr:hypothetical protein FNV43_RR21153 [Rhamnella rubrinervis]
MCSVLQIICFHVGQVPYRLTALKSQLSSDSPDMEAILPNRTFSIPNARSAPPTSPVRRRTRPRRISAEIEEIRVCTNRTCRRQGSFQTLETLTGIAPANVSVKSCGCLGRCGTGPNLVALPEGVTVSHCGTPARAAEVLVGLCGGGVWNSNDAEKSLEALAMRKKAEKEMEIGNFSKAELLLSQAIELKPIGGIYIMYKDRSIARLALGRFSDSLGDAKEALSQNSRYPEAYICQGDAFFAMDQLDLAEKSYLRALDIDPSIRRSKSFKAKVATLQEKLAAVNMP